MILRIRDILPHSLFFFCIFIPFISSTAHATSLFGPPKLLTQPPSEVWFQPGGEDAVSKFTLKCIASDNAEKYVWLKNGEPLDVEGEISWQKPGQAGSILFTRPGPHHIGYYQCYVSNIYGTAVSNRVHVQLGVLDHFQPNEVQQIEVDEGDSLSLECEAPFGQPPPTVFWLYRDTEQSSVIETIRREHIASDNQGRLHFTSVSVHDGRPNLLYECAASSPVLHGEYRAGDRFQLLVNKAPSGARMVLPRALYLSPTEVIVKAGTRLKLQCIIGGLPQPKISWSREGAELPKERMTDLTTSESDYGKSLIVDSIHPEDAGIYHCSSMHIVHRMNVTVEAAPYWEKAPPEDLELAEGETAFLRCLAGGNPPPLVRWTMNGKPIHEEISSTRHMFLDGGRLLQIRDLNHDVDTAVYQCNASNPRGYVYANAFVHAKAHAPRFLMPSYRTWKVVLKSTVQMDCDVDAAPIANVKWVDANDRPIPIIPAKSWILPNHTFVIRDVNSADEGLFYCNVSNKYGIGRATNILQVYKATYFTLVPSPPKLAVEGGQRVEVDCLAVADERLTLIYNWTINDKPIRGRYGDFRLEGTKLVLPLARGWHSGRIQCMAVTDVDAKVSSMYLTVRDVPEWPPLDNVICSERKAIIKWVKPDAHADPIRKYILEMHTDFDKDVWKSIQEVTEVDKDQYEVEISLSPWVNYTFRVAALNSHGRSQDELLSISHEGEKRRASCHTRPSFPYVNPTKVWADGTQPDNLVVHWKPLDKLDWNAPHLQYLIRYRLALPDVAWTEFFVQDAYSKHTVIRELPTFRKFEVQVRAVNAMGPSIVEPESVFGYSGENTPEYPPGLFKVEGVHNLSTVNLSWTPVKPDTMNGHMKGYQIEFWDTAKGRESSKLLNVPAVSHFTIYTLSSCTNYTAVIRSRNSRYVSENSDPVHFETPEGVPTRVTDLMVRAIGSRSILVTWAPPLHSNGVLRGYFLTFSSDTNQTEETYVLHRQSHYLHENVEPESGYIVAVWAETGAGEGPKAIKAVRTWPLRAPDEPRFVLLNLTEREAEFEWKPSEGYVWKMPGSSFYLNYTKDEKTFSSTPPVTLPSTTISISSLTPNTRYHIYGVSKEGELTTVSKEPLFLLTDSVESRSHLNQESVRSAFWFLAVLVAVAVALLAVMVTYCCERRRSGGYAVRRKEMEIGHQMDIDEDRDFIEYQYRFK